MKNPNNPDDTPAKEPNPNANENYTFWRLQRHVGKASREIDRIQKGCGQRNLWLIRREDIEAPDFSRLRSTFSLDAPPDTLQQFLGNTAIAVDGYDDCTEELFEHASIRAYLRTVHMCWPIWLAFCEIDSPGLRLCILCALDDFALVRRARARTLRAIFRKNDTRQLFSDALPLAGAFYLSAGLPPDSFRRHMEAVAKSIGIA